MDMRARLSDALKDAQKQTSDELPVRSFRDLLSHLGTLNRETINFSGQHIEKF